MNNIHEHYFQLPTHISPPLSIYALFEKKYHSQLLLVVHKYAEFPVNRQILNSILILDETFYGSIGLNVII